MHFAQPWLRFNLRTLFAAVTLCAIGTWYWYQRPYPVETWVESLGHVCAFEVHPTAPPPPKSFRVVQYYRRVRGKDPVRHGPYYGYDLQGKLLRSGYFRNGLEDGEFTYYEPDGHKWTNQMKHGLRDGETRLWNGRGELVHVAPYVRGKRHGPTREWDSTGNLLAEENYDTEMRHGRYFARNERHSYTLSGSFENGLPNGAWNWSLQESDVKQINGAWREGQPDGRWEWTDGDGKPILAAEFQGGLAVRVEPTGMSPRVIDHFMRQARSDPHQLGYFFRGTHDSDPRELPLKGLIDRVGSWNLRVVPDLSGLKLAGLESTSMVVVEPNATSWLLALRDVLARHGLGYDLRYGSLCIDTLEGIAAWHDPTGVMTLVPPVRTRLDEIWGESTSSREGKPLRDVLQFRSEVDEVRFDVSRLPETAVSGETGATLDTLVKIDVKSATFRDWLGLLLKQLELRAWLVRETIVIGPQ